MSSKKNKFQSAPVVGTILEVIHSVGYTCIRSSIEESPRKGDCKALGSGAVVRVVRVTPANLPHYGEGIEVEYVDVLPTKMLIKYYIRNSELKKLKLTSQARKKI